jgi:mRNA-degrading endonuclease toxin of MazEF toxin-antitoxin module
MKKNREQELLNEIYDLKYYERELRKNYLNAQNEVVTAITSRLTKSKLPTHIDIFSSDVGLSKNSVILLEQIRTIDKTRLRERLGHLDEAMMQAVNNAISVSFGLTPEPPMTIANPTQTMPNEAVAKFTPNTSI